MARRLGGGCGRRRGVVSSTPAYGSCDMEARPRRAGPRAPCRELRQRSSRTIPHLRHESRVRARRRAAVAVKPWADPSAAFGRAGLPRSGSRSRIVGVTLFGHCWHH